MSEEKRPPGRKSTILVIAGLAVVVVAGILGWLLYPKSQPVPTPSPGPEEIRVPVKKQPLIAFDDTQKQTETKDLMAERKAQYGMEEGVDIIATSEENVKIGDTIVSMQEITEKIRLGRGDVIETDLGGGVPEKPFIYGLYIVQPGDNIWNIHFRFLKEYYMNRGIAVAPMADEPNQRGFSSGIGKLLKFSENLVHIYNIRERELDVDLNLIYPLSKVVGYNMDRIFALLDSIDYTNVDRIEFDGENIWLQAQG
ncbi:hypothetical protein D3OALGB2SA_850 [Olavius algarvensis associated proteobacterium Delta 3]|nr:hypothetical protein D3OALGB2SA_850 [Olavius algarvensis associated proteobacterium Delta 3]